MRRLIGAVLAAVALGGGACSAQPAPGAQNAMSFMAQNALTEGVRTLPSGVQYKVIKSGPAEGAKPGPDDMVKVNYEGSLLTGEVFDSSYKKGKPMVFQVKNLIPGWVEALQQMRAGDEWILYVPPSLGYGAERTGPIPPNSVLVFRLEVLAVGAAAGPPSS